MSEPAVGRCVCHHCSTPLEFPGELEGTTLLCPACQQEIRLEGGGSVAVVPGPLEVDAVALGEVEQAFTGRIRRPWSSPAYGLALLLVSLVVVLLPVVYVAMVGATGYGLFLWADHGRAILGGPGKLLRGLAYVGPLVAGLIALVFMVKPMLARRGRRAQPLALNPAAEPVLHAYVREIARQVGSPLPARVDIDCQLNATAAFRRGWSSLVGGDLVLTLGLPLVAGLTARQLAGVIAHELGHFRQGIAMRLSYVVRGVNGWFVRVVYERDAWDEAMRDWAHESENFISVFLFACAALAVGLSRLLLTLLLAVSHAFSTVLLRQMEHDADRCEIRLVGSATFEATVRRLNVLGYVLHKLYQELQAGWQRNHRLPADLPAELLLRDQRLDPAKRTQLEDKLGLRQAQWHESHPSEAERIRRARKEEATGVVSLDGPAKALFGAFEVAARQVTLLHYTDDLGLPVVPAALY